MTPSLAIHNPIFHLYLIIVTAVLVAAGAALLFVGHVLHRDVSKIWVTYRSWLVMIPLIALAVLIGRTGVIVGVALLSLGGFKEFACATHLDRDKLMTGVVYLMIIAVAACSLCARFELFLAVPVAGALIVALVPILRDRTEGQLHHVAVAVLGFLWIGWMFGHLGFLTNLPNPYGYLLYILFACEVSDVAAFTVGRLFGRHKLRPTISPGKTWAGSLGAIAISLALPWLMWFSFLEFTAAQLLLTGLIVGIGGQIGDLAMSLIKRDLGTKDMGATIPGHGGILDRIDSLIFTAPLFLHMIRFFAPQ
jgi:phosphatidate cytidylyltransferase